MKNLYEGIFTKSYKPIEFRGEHKIIKEGDKYVEIFKDKIISHEHYNNLKKEKPSKLSLGELIQTTCKEGDKYIVKNKIVYSESEFKTHLETQKHLERYRNKCVEYIKNKNWATLGTLNEDDLYYDVHRIVKIDLFMEDFMKYHKEKNTDISDILFQLNQLRIQAKAAIKNPLEIENKVMNKYFLSKIEERIDIIKSVQSYLATLQEQKKTSLPPQQINKDESELSEKEHPEKTQKLKSIWLAEPKITVENFLKKGVDAGIWNEKCKIITQKGSLYGTGKTLLGSIAIAFRGWAISQNTNYNEIGKVFCEVFNISTKETTKEPYKAFSSGNERIIHEIKRVYGVK